MSQHTSVSNCFYYVVTIALFVVTDLICSIHVFLTLIIAGSIYEKLQNWTANHTSGHLV